ncbi:MAG: sigma-54 dependent transcriptional regulator [bacterium]|nr:sigma-54 dependent transcriptional regulator [bacterium]
MADIIVIDDEGVQRKNMSAFLKSLGHQVVQSDSVSRAKSQLQDKEFDIVVSDMRMKDGTGRDILDFLNSQKAKSYFILITAYASVEDSIYILKNGGYDYLPKPVNLDDLERKVKHISALIEMKDENSFLRSGFAEETKTLLYKSENMKRIIEMVDRVADTKAPVMIFGESGTGKELVARMLHDKSARKDKLFVGVNCGALNENLLESELFGYEKGAFTGAQERRKGRFEIADKGTIFLDEVGDISLNMQVKLLRVIQEGEFERVGGNTPVKTDVRIITATHKNMQAMLKEKTFREDLYFRLNVVNVEIPPLRERGEDILLLADHFVSYYSRENNKKTKRLSDSAKKKIADYSYPGNVRELQNIIQRGVILSAEDVISDKDIIIQSDKTTFEPTGGSLEEQVESLEKMLIAESLQKNSGSVKKTAERLKITERILRYKMNKYNIN